MISHVPYYDRNDNYRDPVQVPLDYQQVTFIFVLIGNRESLIS